MKIRRTMLFIPGNNPNMMTRAWVYGSDSIILDVEDAVSFDDKDAARILIRNALGWMDRTRVEYCVRINDVTTPYWRADLEAVMPARPDTIVVPKAESPDDLQKVDGVVTELEKANGIPIGQTKFLPILETAAGIENAYCIGKTDYSNRLQGLMMGAEDLVNSLIAKRTDTSEEILYARLRVVNAARAAGVAPIDTVYAHFENIEGLVTDTVFSRQVGYEGRAVVSPRHIAPVNEVYSPSEKDIAYAYEMLETLKEAKAAGKGAISLHGKMIDNPMIARANQVLEFARTIRGEN